MINTEEMIKFHFCRMLGTYYRNTELLYYFSFFQKSWRYKELSKHKQLPESSNIELSCQQAINMWVGSELKALVGERNATLQQISSEELIAELKKRTDMMFVGNFYDKEQIMELCGANEMEAKDFMEDCNPREDDAVLENADIELQGLFENWQDENEQIIND